MNLEPRPALRLTEAQVAELVLQAPRIQEALNHARLRIKDERGPELQARLVGLLTLAQLQYILDHEEDHVPQLLGDQEEEPWVRELSRFLEARRQGRPYHPLLDPAFLPGTPPGPRLSP